jgi:hypothetical protein
VLSTNWWESTTLSLATLPTSYGQLPKWRHRDISAQSRLNPLLLLIKNRAQSLRTV